MLLAFLAVSLCPLSLIAYRHSEVTRSALTRAAHQSLFAAASQTALRLDTFMAATANVVGTEAKMPALAEYLSRPAGARAPAKEEDVVDMLEAFAEKNSVFTSSVAVLDVHGRIVLDTQPSNIGLDESATRHFRGALETGLPHASGLEFSASDGKPYLSFSSPVKELRGKTAYLESTRRFFAMVMSVEVRDVIVEGAKACALTRYQLQPPGGSRFQSDVAELFTVRDDKIDTFAIYFDTAPFPK